VTPSLPSVSTLRSAKSKTFFLKISLPSAYKTTLGKEETNFFLKKNSLPSASNNALGKEENLFFLKNFLPSASNNARQSWVGCCFPAPNIPALPSAALGKGSLPSAALGKAGIQFLFFAFFQCEHNK